MADLIDRQELLREMLHGNNELYFGDNVYRWYLECVNNAKTIFAELNPPSSSGNPNKWISVKDGLPDRDTRVLTTFVSNKGSTGIEDCFYSGMRNRFVLYHTFEEVPDNITITHWMPLPEPPKED